MRPETLRAPVIGWPVLLALVSLMVVCVTDVFEGVHAAPLQAATVGTAQSPESAWPEKAYRVDWVEADVPEEAAPNVILAMPVTLRNTGDRVWPASAVFVAYHWFRDNKLVIWDGERTPLPRDVRAASRETVAVRVKTPAEPGAYVLQVTLVHENVTWFEQKGATTVIRPVVVSSTTRPADCALTSPPCTP
jgi:hypothetical protein